MLLRAIMFSGEAELPIFEDHEELSGDFNPVEGDGEWMCGFTMVYLTPSP